MSWRQPKLEPSPSTTSSLLDRDRSRPPIFGGRSKKEQLGSVTDSWGPMEGEGHDRAYGIFEIEDDPPSRSTSPFKVASKEAGEIDKQENMRIAKEEALQRARKGTVYDRAGKTDKTLDKLIWPILGLGSPDTSATTALDNARKSPSCMSPSSEASLSSQPISRRELYKSWETTSDLSMEADTSTHPSPPSWLNNNVNRHKEYRQQLAEMMAARHHGGKARGSR